MSEPGLSPYCMTRKNFPKAIEADVLIQCRRRCAFCFCLEGDTLVKRGQLAHIDRNPANASRENAAFLCTPHHDEYDSTSRQTKRFTPEELRAYQKELHMYVNSAEAWLESKTTPRKRTDVKAESISLELYDRRLPTYRTTTQFLRMVHTDYKPDLQEIMKFAHDTDETLFLFDEVIAEYLTELLKKALRLRALVLNREKKGIESPSWQEENELIMWFNDQSGECRRKFAPYLHPKQ
jgi:hypothetical protein